MFFKMISNAIFWMHELRMKAYNFRRSSSAISSDFACYYACRFAIYVCQNTAQFDKTIFCISERVQTSVCRQMATKNRVCDIGLQELPTVLRCQEGFNIVPIASRSFNLNTEEREIDLCDIFSGFKEKCININSCLVDKNMINENADCSRRERVIFFYRCAKSKIYYRFMYFCSIKYKLKYTSGIY